jgi:hypothetical protein
VKVRGQKSRNGFEKVRCDLNTWCTALVLPIFEKSYSTIDVGMCTGQYMKYSCPPEAVGPGRILACSAEATDIVKVARNSTRTSDIAEAIHFRICIEWRTVESACTCLSPSEFHLHKQVKHPIETLCLGM